MPGVTALGNRDTKISRAGWPTALVKSLTSGFSKGETLSQKNKVESELSMKTPHFNLWPFYECSVKKQFVLLYYCLKILYINIICFDRIYLLLVLQFLLYSIHQLFFPHYFMCFVFYIFMYTYLGPDTGAWVSISCPSPGRKLVFLSLVLTDWQLPGGASFKEPYQLLTYIFQ